VYIPSLPDTIHVEAAGAKVGRALTKSVTSTKPKTTNGKVPQSALTTSKKKKFIIKDTTSAKGVAAVDSSKDSTTRQSLAFGKKNEDLITLQASVLGKSAEKSV